MSVRHASMQDRETERSLQEWEQAARAIALRRLAAAPRSVAQIRLSLAERGIPAEVIEALIERFVDVGLLDDAAFARMWVSSRMRVRGLARPVLRRELQARGIADEDIESAFTAVDDDTEEQRAWALAIQRLRVLSGVDSGAAQRRLTQYLMRRGYAAGVAGRISRAVLEAG